MSSAFEQFGSNVPAGAVDMHHLAIYVCVSHEHENGARYLVGRSKALSRQLPREGFDANRPFRAKRSLQALRIDPTGRNRVNAYGSKIEGKSTRQRFHAAKRRRLCRCFGPQHATRSCPTPT